jgi:2-iminobutanoate/2-iminopropanoate deaminase
MPSAGQVYHKRELEKGFYYAQAVRAGNTLYVSGCVSWDAEGNVIGEGDMKAQVHAVYTDLKETLAAHGATFVHVVKENVFTTDMHALEAHNDVRIAYYRNDGSAPPASTWIGCTSLAVPGLMLEIECIAVLDTP